jgi:hypothetical protein
MSIHDNNSYISNWALWQAVKDAPLPGIVSDNWFGHITLKNFEQRLVDECNITDASAQRLVEEYRRFLYLKAIDGGTLSPSKRVDQAWHLHIATPGVEWTRFCNEVLKCQIEHRTGLSAAEAGSSHDRLFDLYRREFNQDPPGDIWPGAREIRRRAIAAGLSIAAFLFLAATFVAHVFLHSHFVTSLFGILFVVALLFAAPFGQKNDLPSNCG